MPISGGLPGQIDITASDATRPWPAAAQEACVRSTMPRRPKIFIRGIAYEAETMNQSDATRLMGEVFSISEGGNTTSLLGEKGVNCRASHRPFEEN